MNLAWATLLVTLTLIGCGSPVPKAPVVVRLPREVHVNVLDGVVLVPNRPDWLGLEPGEHLVRFFLYLDVETAGGLYSDSHSFYCSTLHHFEPGSYRFSIRKRNEKSSVTIPEPTAPRGGRRDGAGRDGVFAVGSPAYGGCGSA